MEITKNQERVVLNALMDSYLKSRNDIDSIQEGVYEFNPKAHWEQLEGVKEILEENKELLSEVDMDILEDCKIFLKKKPK